MKAKALLKELFESSNAHSEAHQFPPVPADWVDPTGTYERYKAAYFAVEEYLKKKQEKKKRHNIVIDGKDLIARIK